MNCSKLLRLLSSCAIFIITVTAFSQSKTSALENYFSMLVKNQQFNGCVLVAENGRIVYEESFGFSDFANKNLNTKKSLFPIASITKTLTSTAILQMAQTGKLNITDPVVKYLDGFPYPAITIRHLLSHTSGLPPYNAYFDSIRKQHPNKIFTNADFINGLVANKKPLIYQPGEKGNYDNINFIVLALIIEKVSETSYNNYIKKHILAPANMTSTAYFPWELYDQDKNERLAFPHVYPHLYSDSLAKANKVPYISGYWHTYHFNGFGDYVSTTHDLLKYDMAYYNGKLLNGEILNEAFTPVQLNNGKNNLENFGLGWLIKQDSLLGKMIFHSGSSPGLSCILLRNISKHQTIVLFDNTHYNAQEIAFNAMKVLNSIPVPYPRKSITKIYAKVLLMHGAVTARDTVNILKKDTTNYLLSEEEMNLLGYDFMGGSNNPNPYHFPEVYKYAEAVETLKMNVELFPTSWNVYDSYGEVLLKVGQKDEAIKMYQKSLELNPKNEGGKKVLEELLK